MSKLLIFSCDKLDLKCPVRGLAPPLYVSTWNSRRSSQIHCLLVSYRPLAPGFYLAKKAVARRRQQFDERRRSHIATPSSSSAKAAIEVVPRALQTRCTLLPPSTPSPRQQFDSGRRPTATASKQRQGQHNDGITDQLRPRTSRLRRLAAPPRRRQGKFRYREGHKSLPIRKRPPRPAPQRPRVITGRITRRVTMGLPPRERRRGL